MRKNPLLFAALAGLLALPVVFVRAQSLADIARAEEARRKTLKTPGRVYTNDDLKGGGGAGAPAPATPPPPAVAKPGETAKPDVPPEPPATDGTPKDEKYWRGRITGVQQGLARNKVLLDALQSRVNALTTDFTNMADPAQRAVIEENRKTALAEMARVQKDMENGAKEIATIEEEARKASVPPGWLR
jgi:hypothetical protein